MADWFQKVHDQLQLMGYRVRNSALSEVNDETGEPFIVNTISPHSYVTAKNDSLFADALRASDILVPDGSGICLAARILKGKRMSKIAGADVFEYYLKTSNSQNGRVFFLGSTERVLGLIGSRLAREYPNVTAGYYSPPYKPEFDENESDAMIAAVNDFGPDVLFVGMTAPKQEKWVHQHKHRLNAKVICSIGAVFDFYAGTVKRSGKIWIKMGLEWLPRLCREPRRLFKRNFVSTPLFLLDVLLARIGLKHFDSCTTASDDEAK